MRKFVVPALSLALCLGLTAGCSSKTDAPAASTGETTAAASAESTSEAAASAETKSIDSLKIAFSPYADADTITTATEPLENLLKETLLEKGYDVKNIDCSPMTATFSSRLSATPSIRTPKIRRNGTTAPSRKTQTK